MNGIDIFIHSLKEIDHIWVRLHFQQMPTVFQIAKNENKNQRSYNISDSERPLRLRTFNANNLAKYFNSPSKQKNKLDLVGKTKGFIMFLITTSP